jgi:pyruvate/2-oxoglutarate dehydrogenase complex dihydrolipoamide acyltransferase (E2) component
MTATAQTGPTDQAAAPEYPGVAKPLAGIRMIAARRMVEAWAAPVFHLGVDVDMGAVLAADLKAVGSTVTDAILQACAAALVEQPGLNAHYADNVITTFADVNIGLAVATDKGLTVPVLHRLQGGSLSDIAGKRKDVVSRARTGKLSMKDISDGTFTVSNLGMLGIDEFDAILDPPQIGILAIGSTRTMPVAQSGQVELRPISRFTLTCDHRAVDGAAGAGLLTAIRRQLESFAV